MPVHVLVNHVLILLCCLTRGELEDFHIGQCVRIGCSARVTIGLHNHSPLVAAAAASAARAILRACSISSQSPPTVQFLIASIWRSAATRAALCAKRVP